MSDKEIKQYSFIGVRDISFKNKMSERIHNNLSEIFFGVFMLLWIIIGIISCFIYINSNIEIDISTVKSTLIFMGILLGYSILTLVVCLSVSKGIQFFINKFIVKHYVSIRTYDIYVDLRLDGLFISTSLYPEGRLIDKRSLKLTRGKTSARLSKILKEPIKDVIAFDGEKATLVLPESDCADMLKDIDIMYNRQLS